MRRLLTPCVLVFVGCASTHEAAGERALRAGDTRTALREFEAALARRPIMDAEYERLRDKRVELLEGQWGPKTTAALDEASNRRPLAAVAGLLEVRAQLRDARAAFSSVKRIDEAMLDKLSGWVPADGEELIAELDQVMALFTRAHATHATLPLLQRLTQVMKTGLDRGLPPVTPGTARERLSTLLRWRAIFRAHGFPVALDQRVGELLSGLDARALSPATGAAQANATAAWALRNQARELDAPPGALALADAVWADAEGALSREADAAVKAQHYLAAAQGLHDWVARAPTSSPLRAHLAKLCAEGAAHHRAEAAKATGYRQLLHASIVESLGATGGRAQLLESLADWKTTLAYQPTTSAPPGCEQTLQALGALFSPNGAAGKLQLTLRSCALSTPDRTFTRRAPYPFIETWQEEEQVQVGTRLERVASGTHQEQCSKPASLEGYTWTGLCTVQDYENRQVPVFETRLVTKSREVTRYTEYDVTEHVFAATVAGTATLTWEDGSAHTFEISGAHREAAETWSYVLPGSSPTAAGTPRRQDLPPGFSGAPSMSAAITQARDELGRALLTKLRALRAEAARKVGEQALARGDGDAAAGAFVRSVLIDGRAEGAAATWLTATLGTDARLVEAVLGGAAPLTPGPSTFAEVKPRPWASQGLSRPPADDYERSLGAYEGDVSTITQSTYQSGIMPPNEFVDAHVGIVPGEIQLSDQLGGRVAVQVGFDGHYSFLEMLGLRYGFAVHDELGLRLTIGISTAKATEYTNDETETPLAWSIDASYSLVAGLRLPWFSVMVGGVAGYQHYAIGSTLAYGFHVEPAARIALRLFNIKQLILEGSGFIGIPGVPHKNRLALSFPLLGEDGLDLKFTAEETVFNATQLDLDGKTQVSLGPRPAHMVGLQVGARF